MATSNKQVENQGSSRLQKIESISKIIAAVSIPLVGLMVTIFLHIDSEANRNQQLKLTEKNRQAQLFAEIMSRRESSDSDIRAAMFNTLLTNYLGKLTSDDPGNDSFETLKRKEVFLKLLTSNFQEYFNAKPLFEDLYERIRVSGKKSGLEEKKVEKLKDLQKDLIKLAKSTAKKQEVMLARVGTSFQTQMKKGDYHCVSLYDPQELVIKIGEDLVDLEREYTSKCVERYKDENRSSTKNNKYTRNKTNNINNALYSLEMRVREIRDNDIEVEITVWRDFFDDNLYDYSRIEKDSIIFNVSYFDLPFMDNTRLFEGSRFALVLRDIPNKDFANIDVITFREEFMSLRDRPFFEEMLSKLKEVSE
jgi:hypothetical protein